MSPTENGEKLERMQNLMQGACIEAYGYTDGLNVGATIIPSILDNFLDQASKETPGEEFYQEYMTEDKKLKFRINGCMVRDGDDLYCGIRSLVVNDKKETVFD